jgi:membrane protein
MAGEEELFGRIREFMNHFLPFLPRETLDNLATVVHGRRAFGLLGVAALLLSSHGALGALEQALRRIFGDSPRHFIVQRVIVAGLVLGAGFLLAVSIFVTTHLTEMAGEYIPALLRYRHALASFPVTVYLTPVVLLMAGFVIIIKYLAGSRIGWGLTVAGGGLFAALFTLARILYHLYLHGLSNLNALYGSLTAVVVLVLWVYYLSCIILLSGQFMRAVRERRGG